MISEMRTYFESVIKSVDPDLRFDGFIFESEQISSNVVDSTYKLLIKDTQPLRLDTSYKATTSIEIIIYRKSGTDRVFDFDKAYCKAIEISSTGIDQRRVDQSGIIKNITGGLITPESLDGDDNSVRIRIQFNVETYYSIEEY